MGQIRVVFNQKGGVGKSSLTVNLAAISAAQGLNTLVVDLDPQCNSTQYLLGEDVVLVESTAMDLFASALKRDNSKGKGDGKKKDREKSSARLLSFITQTAFPNLDLIAADAGLLDIESKLESRHKIFKLRNSLRKLTDYDAIYIDTAPAYNFFTQSALIAADSCLIPFDCDDFSRRALYTLLENVEEIQEDHNEELEIEGIVVNQYQPRASLPRQIVEELRAEGLPILNSVVSQSVKMRESHSVSRPMIDYAPSHKLTQELLALYREVTSSARVAESA